LGYIILSVLFSNPYGAYAPIVSSILSSISFVWESLHPFLNCGCVNQCVKYMKYLNHTFKDLIRPQDVDIKQPQISIYDDKSLDRIPEYNPEISFLSTETYAPIDEGSIRPMKDFSQTFRESNQSIYTEDSADKRIEQFERQRAKEKHDAEIAVVRLSYVHCVEIILHIAEHAAGLFRVAQRVTNTGRFIYLYIDVNIFIHVDTYICICLFILICIYIHTYI
jgi:hypothetical protein